MCIKASRKLQALACVASTIHGPIRKKIFNECFFQYLNLQFSYSLHKSCLRLIYNSKQLAFEELLEKDNSVSIHIRNLQTLVTEMYKVMNGDSPEIMKIFRIREENG